MLYSMTGFGRAEKTTPSQRIVVEIKSINSKSFDMRAKIAPQYLSKDIELRKMLNDRLQRGKVDVIVMAENASANDNLINVPMFNSYYKSLMAIIEDKGIDQGDLIYTITRLPGVIAQHDDQVNDGQWEEVLEVLEEALIAFDEYRSEEGGATENDIQENLAIIQELLEEVNPEEQGRIDKIKNRLMNSLEQLALQGKVDENRLEQEMIYYLDKFDLNEEKVRLQQHCTYFVEELEKDIPAKGKKLSFILQEMGREINTLGSKANSAEIQRLVIQMKNTADKIKEQLANIL